MHLAFISTHSPRRCGLATFNGNLMAALRAKNVRCDVASLTRPDDPVTDSRWTIQQGDPASFVAVAKAINESSAEAVVLQHEFGLYGHWVQEEDGNYTYHNHLEDFFHTINVPVITTLHTVQEETTRSMRAALRFVTERSARVVVMAETAKGLLHSAYGLLHRPLIVPHGVPHIERVDRDAAKQHFALPGLDVPLEGRTVVTTCGFVDPRKGIEDMIAAMPEIIRRHPEVLYLVIGQTHPDYVKHNGEQYRNRLQEQIRARGLSDHVRLVDRFLTDDELVRCLQVSDMYAMPYRDPNQITSGTLAEALAAGLAIVSTPYLHAKEMLADGRGVLTGGFADPSGLAQAVNVLLDNPALKAEVESRAYAYGSKATWPNVASSLLDALRVVVAQRREVQTIITTPARRAVSDRPTNERPTRAPALIPVAPTTDLGRLMPT